MTEQTGRRDITEQKLIEAVGRIVKTDGFRSLGINRVAKEAGCDKVLIYRYFNNLDGLIEAFLQKNDLYSNIQIDQWKLNEINTKEELKHLTKTIFRNHFTHLLENENLQEIYRWELIDANKPLQKIAEQREKQGIAITELFKSLVPNKNFDAEAAFAILSSAIHYLVLRSKTANVFNGLNFDNLNDWGRIWLVLEQMIDDMIEQAYRQSL